MLQNIEPHEMHNEFRKQNPKMKDYLIVFNGSQTLLKKVGDNFSIPTFEDFEQSGVAEALRIPCHYLISIDDSAYFLADDFLNVASTEALESTLKDYEFASNRAFRSLVRCEDRLGGATSAHIARWESLNKFCGRCGEAMSRGETERSMVCPACKNTVYPKISPVVIVAVHDGSRLLMARNLDNPNKKLMFLISGFVEIGESLEQACAREVLEEAGVRIKNVKYFGSQPWPFSESLISGYTAELDGEASLKIQTSEIEKACWVERKDIPPYDTSVSISCAMIESFRTQKS